MSLVEEIVLPRKSILESAKELDKLNIVSDSSEKVKDYTPKMSLFEFQEYISEIAESNPAFKKSVLILLNGGTYEDALEASFTKEEIEDITNSNCGEITTEGIQEAFDDEVTFAKAKFLLKKIETDFSETDAENAIETN